MLGNFIDKIQTATEDLALVSNERTAAQLERILRRRLPKTFTKDEDYFNNVILRSYQVLRHATTELTLPMVSTDFQKKDALPAFMMGLLWDDWERNDTDSSTVFLENLADRGTNNAKKKTYFSALTPDLYQEQYRVKIEAFCQSLLSPNNAGKPLLSLYEERYLELFWDLHLQVKPEDIPDFAKKIGLEFINCWAIFNPLDFNDLESSKEFKKSYQYVREHRTALKEWINGRVETIKACPENYNDSFVKYWFENDPENNFETADVTFECFHNFIALSQWGNTFYKFVDLLRTDNTSATAQAVQTKFNEVFSAEVTKDDKGFTDLDYLVLELFRVSLPNGGSISRYYGENPSGSSIADKADELVVQTHYHPANSPTLWEDSVAIPNSTLNNAPFNPDRYKNVPLAHEVDEEALKKAGALAKCPFDHSSLETADGRSIENNAFGTTFAKTSEGKTCPMVETAGFSPFGFGYRRCPGEMLTVEVFKTILTEVNNYNVSFYELMPAEDAEKIAIAPGTILSDNLAMRCD